MPIEYLNGPFACIWQWWDPKKVQTTLRGITTWIRGSHQIINLSAIDYREKFLENAICTPLIDKWCTLYVGS